MVTSMTGFGKGSARLGEGELTVEIRTVNHRFVDFSIRTPRPLSGYDSDIEKLARRSIRRGHVYITVAFDRDFEAENFALNKRFLKKTWKEISGFAASEGIPGEVDINTLLTLPEAFTSLADAISEKKLKAAVNTALGAALERCNAMREREGEALRADISKHLAVVAKTTVSIEKKSPAALKKSLSRVKARLEQLMGNAGLDESRWATEAALLADKADFSEELVRLKSHLDQFSRVLEKGGEVSKKLTFLLQEIHREATTMGNKATDSVIIRD
ncbi:MAG TPA: YicC/YloC family endoribonuclease, partial [Candidatus Krumholzibacterium sp.]|nr:YicC/YloC family endoribonuclease [Candidatus Krumholzibacterium sp.]